MWKKSSWASIAACVIPIACSGAEGGTPLSHYELLVASASYATGAVRNGVYRFDPVTGQYLGQFGCGAKIYDPRGIRLSPDGKHVMVNNGDDRILEFTSSTGDFSGQLPLVKELNPGGSKFGKDGRYYVGSRSAKSIVVFDVAHSSEPKTFVPGKYVKFPRGLAVSAIGDIYLASGINPQTGEGQNTILRFRQDGSPVTTFNVVDAGLSPTDTEIGPNGDLFSGSELPFNSPHATTTVREYDGRTGTLKRVFDAGVDTDGQRVTQKPRGITFGPDGDLYASGLNNVVRYSLATGKFDGVVISRPGINAQSLIFIPKMQSSCKPTDSETKN